MILSMKNAMAFLPFCAAGKHIGNVVTSRFAVRLVRKLNPLTSLRNLILGSSVSQRKFGKEKGEA